MASEVGDLIHPSSQEEGIWPVIAYQARKKVCPGVLIKESML